MIMEYDELDGPGGVPIRVPTNDGYRTCAECGGDCEPDPSISVEGKVFASRSSARITGCRASSTRSRTSDDQQPVQHERVQLRQRASLRLPRVCVAGQAFDAGHVE